MYVQDFDNTKESLGMAPMLATPILLDPIKNQKKILDINIFLLPRSTVVLLKYCSLLF